MNKKSRTLIMYYAKYWFLSASVLTITFLMAGVAYTNIQTKKLNRPMLFQYSTINALAEGYYDSNFTIKNLLKYGDFGIGTFEGLDGEMIVENGQVYQVRTDGAIVEVTSETKTPFAIVVPFKPDTTISVEGKSTYEELCACLDSLRSSDNYIYAIRIPGIFSEITTRTVPRQDSAIRLVDVVQKQQVKFEEKGVKKGVLIGFYFPSYMKDINVTGYHFHFIADDHSIAGHVLGIRMEEGVVELNQINDFSMQLPESKTFSRMNLMQTKDHELHIIEKQKH